MYDGKDREQTLKADSTANIIILIVRTYDKPNST
jgi:hypothetical protein